MKRSTKFGLCGSVLTLLLVPLGLVAQGTGTITGRVINAQTLQPLASTQVAIPTLSIGTLTGANGTYQLNNVPAGPVTVVAQRIGSRASTQQVTVTAGATMQLNFTLDLEVVSLDEVIVTGTPGGTQRRAVGNTVERVSLTTEIEARPITTMEQALTAAAPGVNMLSNATDVGGGARIRLRGSSSASLAGDPVIIVDGIRLQADVGRFGTGQGEITSSYSRLTDINPNDIESIEIIKGPAAATLYGTEAANGVIQIITKRGVVGQTRLNAALEVGANWIPLINTPDYWFRRPDGQLARINLIKLEPDYVLPENPYGGLPLKQTGMSRGYTVSAQGGSDVIRYFLSFNRRDAEGTWRSSYDTRNTVRGTLGVNVRENMSVDLSLSMLWGDLSGGRGLGGTAFGDMVFSGAEVVAFRNTLAPPRRGWRGTMPEGQHPDVFEQAVELGRSTASVTVTHEPFSWLTQRLVMGRDESLETVTALTRKNDFLAEFCCGGNAEGSKSVATQQALTQSLDYSASVTVDPTERLNSVTSFGLQYYNLQRNDLSASGNGFATPTLTIVGAAGERTGSEEWLENTTLGVFFQQQVGINNRIFVTGAVRADDSSAFGNEFTWAIYPKFSATWVVHEESFWNFDAINQFRLRSAWGAAGQQPDLIAASRLYQPVAGPEGTPAISALSFGNPNLGPERGEEFEMGFDVEFLDGRVGGTFTRYWRKTKDGILATPLAASLGFNVAASNDLGGSEYFANLGEISGRGTETTLNWQVLDRNPLRWNLDFAFTTMGNRIESLGGIDRIAVPRARDHVVGYPLASIFDKKVVSAEFANGVSGALTNVMCDGGVWEEGKALPMPGGDAVPCAEAPEVFWGAAEPTRTAVLRSTFDLFTNWQLSATMDYKGGHWANHEYLALRQTSYPANVLINLNDNPVSLAYLSIHRNTLANTRSSFARIQDIQLSYSMQSGLLDKLGLTSGRIGLGMNNVGIIWQAQSHVERDAITDPDSNRSDQNFGGETRGQFGFRQVNLRMDVSF